MKNATKTNEDAIHAAHRPWAVARATRNAERLEKTAAFLRNDLADAHFARKRSLARKLKVATAAARTWRQRAKEA